MAVRGYLTSLSAAAARAIAGLSDPTVDTELVDVSIRATANAIALKLRGNNDGVQRAIAKVVDFFGAPIAQFFNFGGLVVNDNLWTGYDSATQPAYKPGVLSDIYAFMQQNGLVTYAFPGQIGNLMYWQDAVHENYQGDRALTYGSFGGWDGVFGTMTRSLVELDHFATPTGYRGGIRFTATTGTSPQFASVGGIFSTNIPAGTALTFGVNVLRISGTAPGAQVFINWWTSAGGFISTSAAGSTATLSTSAYAKPFVTIPLSSIPSNAAKAQILCVLTTGAVSGAVVQLCGAFIKVGTDATNCVPFVGNLDGHGALSGGAQLGDLFFSRIAGVPPMQCVVLGQPWEQVWCEADPPRPPAAPKPQVGRAGFGEYGSTTTNPVEQTAIAVREGQLGRQFASATHFYAWNDLLPDSNIITDLANGRTPVITWMPTSIALSGIASGAQDRRIVQVARALRDLRQPLFLRWAMEMNTSGFTWGLDFTNYIPAWQHIYNLFQQCGATNVSFVWAPNYNSTTSGTNPTGVNSWRNFYPGDAYVDWLGLDVYNFGTNGGGSWKQLQVLANPVLADFASNMGGVGGAGKPVMFPEWGVISNANIGTAGSAQGRKGHWLTDASGYLRTSGVRLANYFDTNNSSTGIAWAVDSDTDALAAFKEVLQDPYFGGSDRRGTAYPAAVLADVPLAYLRFNELSGTFADSANNSHTATAGGGFASSVTYSCTGLTGGLGQAVAVNGGGQVQWDTLGGFGSGLGSGGTIEFLYKDATNQVPGAIIGQLDTGTSTGVMVLVNTNHSLSTQVGRTTFWVRNSSGNEHYAEVSTAIYDGLWHHVVWVINPAGTDIVYIDGVAQTLAFSTGAIAGTWLNLVNGVYLGGRNNRGTADQNIACALDEVAVYTTQLSAARARMHYLALTA